MITPENITIVFTAYNQLPCLKLALHTFLKFYPQYKKSIRIFDDHSDKELSDWCSSQHIEVFSWKEKTFISDFGSYLNLYPATSLSLRNAWMLSEIVKDCKTEFLMLNDNDIIFLRPGFLERYDLLLRQGY